jgi:ubiquinone/menaquinone biosynthesis C-methylase UbiE
MNLPKNSKVIDIGSAYGRFAIVIRALRPDINFKGLELVKERAEEGIRILSKLECENSEIIQTDVTEKSFDFEEADAYFCYDFSNIINIELVLNKLKNVCRKKKTYIISRGELINSVISKYHPWLVINNDISPTLKIYQTDSST